MLPSGDMGDTGTRVAEVRRRIESACERTGRDSASVELLAVSKKVPADRVREAIDAGIRALGENRVQEAEQKKPLVDAPAAWHLIGRLQSNKVRLAAALFDVIHSVDRISLVRKLASAAADLERPLPVYAQAEYVRTDRRERDVERGVQEVCETILKTDGLELVGLMILPPWESDPEATRPWFRKLRLLRDRIAEELNTPLPGLSMGMTNDFEIAIEEGATIVRVGTAIFGPREP